MAASDKLQPKQFKQSTSAAPKGNPHTAFKPQRAYRIQKRLDRSLGGKR